MGHGDVTVNKKMKILNRIFHDILLKFVNKNDSQIKVNEILKFLIKNVENQEISHKLHDYFTKYQDFCFDIVNKNMLKDFDKFEY